MIKTIITLCDNFIHILSQFKLMSRKKTIGHEINLIYFIYKA